MIGIKFTEGINSFTVPNFHQTFVHFKLVGGIWVNIQAELSAPVYVVCTGRTNGEFMAPCIMHNRSDTSFMYKDFFFTENFEGGCTGKNYIHRFSEPKV